MEKRTAGDEYAFCFLSYNRRFALPPGLIPVKKKKKAE
jgi:hypothetical protein